MEFLDVLFPVNIGPLTYRYPEMLSRGIKPGMLVSAPLRNRIAKGIILGKSPAAPSSGVKDIQEVHGISPFFSRAMMDLLKWMSHYYMTGQGLVLKTVLPKEALEHVKRRGRTKEPPGRVSSTAVDVDADIVDILKEAVSGGAYVTYLLHAPSSGYELSFLLKVIAGIRDAIILVPEVSVADRLYPLFKDAVGDRLSLFHGGMSRGRRSETIELILSGRSDIVLGTRSAVFSPLKKISFIAVVQEHSESYKQEKSPCYIGRDVAVMRGYLDKATVLLSSICPSVESFFNCKSGKYSLLKPRREVERPRIRLINMKREKLARPYLSQAVTDAAAGRIKDNRKVMFILNRRGHSTLLQCGDCGHIEECPNCRIPLVFHKQDMSLKCHYCGHAMFSVPELCGICRGHNLKLSGAGTQKVQEDLHELTGAETLRLDSDKAGRKRGLECMSSPLHDNRIIIGTKLMTKRICPSAGFSMAAFLNTDLFLNMPDFRSAEKTYREIATVLDGLDADGEMFIQTRMPHEYLYRYLKKNDYVSFIREELARRKALNYPPYSRLLLLKYTSGKDISRELTGILKTVEGVEILGPLKARNSRGKNEFRLLLKSPIRDRLHSAAEIFINAFKNSKDVETRIDVDPITI